jgi:hypothetical protein
MLFQYYRYVKELLSAGRMCTAIPPGKKKVPTDCRDLITAERWRVAYFTGKYPTVTTICCPSGERIQSIYSFNAPVGLLLIYI